MKASHFSSPFNLQSFSDIPLVRFLLICVWLNYFLITTNAQEPFGLGEIPSPHSEQSADLFWNKTVRTTLDLAHTISQNRPYLVTSIRGVELSTGHLPIDSPDPEALYWGHIAVFHPFFPYVAPSRMAFMFALDRPCTYRKERSLLRSFSIDIRNEDPFLVSSWAVLKEDGDWIRSNHFRPTDFHKNILFSPADFSPWLFRERSSPPNNSPSETSSHGFMSDNEAEKGVVLERFNSVFNKCLVEPDVCPTDVLELVLFAKGDGVGEIDELRDSAIQFLGRVLARRDGVLSEDRVFIRETLQDSLYVKRSTFAGTALRALHRGDPSDPLVASNALRIARDSSYPSSSRATALLVLEECTSSTFSTSSPVSAPSTLAETAVAVSADPSASSLLRQTAEAVLKRLAAESKDDKLNRRHASNESRTDSTRPIGVENLIGEIAGGSVVNRVLIREINLVAGSIPIPWEVPDESLWYLEIEGLPNGEIGTPRRFSCYFTTETENPCEKVPKALLGFDQGGHVFCVSCAVSELVEDAGKRTRTAWRRLNSGHASENALDDNRLAWSPEAVVEIELFFGKRLFRYRDVNEVLKDWRIGPLAFPLNDGCANGDCPGMGVDSL